jgi:hypothetical protein
MTDNAAQQLLDRIDNALPQGNCPNAPHPHWLLVLSLRERNLLADALEAYLDMLRQEDDE